MLAGFSFIFTILRLLGAPDHLFWALSVLSPVAMSSVAANMWRSGVTWHSFNAGRHPPAKIVAVMLFDTVLYLLLAMHLERALAPGRFDHGGSAGSWLFWFARRLSRLRGDEAMIQGSLTGKMASHCLRSLPTMSRPRISRLPRCSCPRLMVWMWKPLEVAVGAIMLVATVNLRAW